MPILGVKNDTAEEPSRRLRPRLRTLLRAIHRDAGYVAVGLTVVYALSGLAVNHIADWDPNFKSYEHVHMLGPLHGTDAEITRRVLGRLGIAEAPKDIYRASGEQLEITFEKRSIHVDTRTGRVIDEGQSPRFLLRAANWLHLNRGKKAWTYVADTYAGALLLLAGSGMFMLPGRRGIVGRGGILVALGAAIPILYVALSGGH